MNEQRTQLIAYCATLFALVAVASGAAWAAASKEDAAAGALSSIAVGLIGVLRMPTTQRTAAAVGSADSVNVTSAPGKE